MNYELKKYFIIVRCQPTKYSKSPFVKGVDLVMVQYRDALSCIWIVLNRYDMTSISIVVKPRKKNKNYD